MSESNNNADMQETKLEDQEQIVNQYLEELLSEVAEYSETDIATEVQLDKAKVVPIKLVPDVVSEEVQEQQVAEQLDVFEEELDGQVERPAPDWAHEPFQCLIFRVGDITLATPLLALDNIVKWDTDLTPMPFQPDWHMGVMQYRDNKIVVVDTAKILKLDRSQDDTADRESGSHILIVGDHRFGLACDSLARPLFLHEEEVHWAVKHEDRPWMAGTIKEKLTILLDIDALLEVIRHE